MNPILFILLYLTITQYKTLQPSCQQITRYILSILIFFPYIFVGLRVLLKSACRNVCIKGKASTYIAQNTLEQQNLHICVLIHANMECFGEYGILERHLHYIVVMNVISSQCSQFLKQIQLKSLLSLFAEFSLFLDTPVFIEVDILPDRQFKRNLEQAQYLKLYRRKTN